MSVNALLVRWQGGWRVVDNVPSGRRRRERMVDLSATSEQAVDTVGAALLANFADVRQQTTAEVEPKSDADRAFLAYGIGDTIDVQGPDGELNAERVLALTATWSVASPGGHPEVAPQLRDVLLSQQDAFEQALQRMNRGALGGGSPAVGVPTDPRNNGERQTEPHRWGWSVPTLGPVDGAPWMPPARIRPIRANMTLHTGSVSYARLEKNGTPWIDLMPGYGGPGGWTVTTPDLTADYGDLITIVCAGSGTGFNVDLEWYPVPAVT